MNTLQFENEHFMMAHNTNRFERSGDYWIVSFDGRTIHLRDGCGARYLAELLRRPDTAIAAIDLATTSVRNDGASRPRGHRTVATRHAGAHDAERARLNVSRAIHSTLRKLQEHHPSLANHLLRTIRTGKNCIYTPDPRLPTHWHVE